MEHRRRYFASRPMGGMRRNPAPHLNEIMRVLLSANMEVLRQFHQTFLVPDHRSGLVRQSHLGPLSNWQVLQLVVQRLPATRQVHAKLLRNYGQLTLGMS